MITNPLSDPSVYDTFVIGGVSPPGYVVLSGWSRPHAWEKKGGKGQKGQSIELTNLPLANGSVTFHLWEESHFDDWDIFAAVLVVDPTKKSVFARDVSHPILARLGVKSVVVEDIGQEKRDSSGLTTIEVKFVEYSPPPAKPANANPSGSKGNGNGPSDTKRAEETDPPVVDALQQRLAELAALAGRPSA